MVDNGENFSEQTVPAAGALPDPIAILENDQDEYLKLCIALEEIADALPGNVDFSKAEAAVLLLRGGFAAHVQAQERILFPVLRQRAAAGDGTEAHLRQIEYEHAADQGLAVEVAEALADLITRRRAANPDMLGYLLRCFFEGYRRHAAWERQVIYAICRIRLTPEDRAGLTRRLLRLPRFAFRPAAVLAC